MKTLQPTAAVIAATILSTVVAATTLFSTSAFAGGGAHAGDGVLVDGQLKMRDFIETNKANGGATRVAHIRKYLEQLPGFMPLFKEIAAADPEFAFEIWMQLNDTRIWLIPAKLPLLPFADTTLTGPKPQVQIAIHYSNDIMISTTAMAQLPASERPYELIHEALHGLIGGNGPIHEMRVMYMTKWLHTHRGHYTTAALRDELDRIGVKQSNNIDTIAVIWHINDFNRALAIFIKQAGTPQSLCLLQQAIGDSAGGSLAYITNYYGPENCPTQDPVAAIKSFSPTLAQLLKHSIPDVSSDASDGAVMVDNFYIQDLSKWSQSRSECRTYANPALSGTIEASVLKYQSLIELAKRGESDMTRLRETLDGTYSQDPAQVAAIYLFIQRTGYPFSNANNYYTLLHLGQFITKSQETISGPLATAQTYLKQNIKICLNKYDQY